MRGEALVQSTAPSDFLTCWDSLSHPKTCSELNSVWSAITEQADLINPKGLNELWEFYLERLAECETGQVR